MTVAPRSMIRVLGVLNTLLMRPGKTTTGTRAASNKITTAKGFSPPGSGSLLGFPVVLSLSVFITGGAFKDSPVAPYRVASQNSERFEFQMTREVVLGAAEDEPEVPDSNLEFLILV